MSNIPQSKSEWEEVFHGIIKSGIFSTELMLREDVIEYVGDDNLPVVQRVVYIEGLDNPDGEDTDDNRFRLATVYEPTDSILADEIDIEGIASVFITSSALLGQVAKKFSEIESDGQSDKLPKSDATASRLTVARLFWQRLKTRLPEDVLLSNDFVVLDDILGVSWMDESFLTAKPLERIDYSDVTGDLHRPAFDVDDISDNVEVGNDD